MTKTFNNFNEAAQAIVSGEIIKICAQVVMFSDILNRNVTYRGECVLKDGSVTFKPDSARLSFQYGYIK